MEKLRLQQNTRLSRLSPELFGEIAKYYQELLVAEGRPDWPMSLEEAQARRVRERLMEERHQFAVKIDYIA